MRRSRPTARRILGAATALTLALLATTACGPGTPEPDGGEALPSTTASPALNDALAARLDSLDEPVLDSLHLQGRAPLWVVEEGLTDRGRTALRILGEVEREGLDPTRYGYPELRRLHESVAGDPGAAELAALETGLTLGVTRLSRDLARGRLASTSFDPAWEVDTQDPVLPEGRSPKASELLAHLDRVRPGARQYERLVDVRLHLEEVAQKGGWDRVPSTGDVVEPGDSSQVVAALRRRLSQSLDPEERRLAGRHSEHALRFDSALSRGLARFQGRHGIVSDGVLGPETTDALNATVGRRREEVRIALERWRWLPTPLGTPAVLVNTPERTLHVLEDGAATLSMKVIVGQRDWRTALFQDEMEHIVVNPYWNVPESILEEETLPKARKDPDYMRENRFEVVDPETDDTVALSSLDWDEVEVDDFPYRVRQKPGDGNALGRVKFMFPNRHDIYLHDTPADQLFDQRLRVLSHGCVRVEHPGELARFVLREATDEPPTRFEELKATEEHHVIPLDRPIPTYLIYQTVWVDERGVPTFSPDIYERDAAVREALARADGGPAPTQEAP